MLIYIDNLLFKAVVFILSDFFSAQPQNLKYNFLNGLLFFSVSLFVWKSSVQITKQSRQHFKLSSNIYKRLATLILLNGVVSATTIALIFSIWKNYVQNVIVNQVYLWCIVGFLAASFITVLYECFYLNKEIEVDKKVFKQLENERIDTEINILKNELNPHFIFNSLTALSHLINHDQQKAQMFTQKLSQVYKYFLINKDKEIISLEEELNFLNDYFFLLKIRYDNLVRLNVCDTVNYGQVLILPCALQILVENAIKHNMFTEDAPLEIEININKNFLVITNTLRSKLYAVDSTKIGLKNLSHRYRLLTQKNIITYSAKDKFIVKLPLVKEPIAKLI